jgi:hypothetical protein
MRRIVLALAPAILAAGLAAAPAGAGAYQQVLRVYEREGSIPACQFTSAQLQTALAGVDTYGAQYFADFTQAVQTALSARAGGACTAAPAGATAAIRAGAPLAPPPRTGMTAGTSAGVPLALAVLGVIAALAAAAGTGAALVAGRRRLSR